MTTLLSTTSYMGYKLFFVHNDVMEEVTHEYIFFLIAQYF